MNWEAEKQGAAPMKKKRSWLKILVVVLVVIAIIGAFRSMANAPKSKDLVWPESGLATVLPKPDSSKGDVIVNSDEELSVDVDGYDDKKYAAYVEECKSKGFTVDAKTLTSSYEAYSEEGYHLRLSGYSDSMHINLEAPVAMDDISWPEQGPGSLAPKPEGAKGQVKTNSSTQFNAIVGQTDKSAFDAYCNACADAGFNIDFDKSDTYYRAKDAAGNSLSVEYEGNNTMSVSVSAAKDQGAASSSSSSAAQSDSQQAAASTESAPASNVGSDGVNADLKAFLDEYEAFVDEYVSFIQKYNSDSSNAVSMAADYAKMMARYSDFSAKAAAYNQDEMSDADLAYYLEVTNRVNQKLASVA